MLDRLHLLAQEILALRFIDLFAGVGVDLLLHGQQIDLPVEHLMHPFEAGDRIQHLQHRLGIFDLQFEVAGQEIRESTRILEVAGNHHHFRGDRFPEGDAALERAFGAAQEGFLFE